MVSIVPMSVDLSVLYIVHRILACFEIAPELDFEISWSGIKFTSCYTLLLLASKILIIRGSNSLQCYFVRKILLVAKPTLLKMQILNISFDACISNFLINSINRDNVIVRVMLKNNF